MDACATFELKWTNAFPEFGLSLRFVGEKNRAAHSALTCIGFEMGHVALRIGEAPVAVGKLQWWMEELLSMRSGQPRHPLTQALARTARIEVASGHQWQRLALEALAQRDVGPAASLDQLIAACRPFHLAFARIENALFDDGDANVRADALVLSRLLRDGISLEDAIARGALPLPLSLLAKHRLARADLAIESAARNAALREHFAALAERMRALELRSLSVIGAASLHAERVRSEGLARSSSPLGTARIAMKRLPPSTLWIAWRAARRHGLQRTAGSRYP
ncbi:MAG: hypothetical protein ABI650_09265 [Dokdonella sp.]